MRGPCFNRGGAGRIRIPDFPEGDVAAVAAVAWERIRLDVADGGWVISQFPDLNEYVEAVDYIYDAWRQTGVQTNLDQVDAGFFVLAVQEAIDRLAGWRPA